MQQLNINKRRIGVNARRDGFAEVCVWAPDKQEIFLHIEEPENQIALEKDSLGFWYAPLNAFQQGVRYKYRVDGELFPDPASLWQPEGVHGCSAFFDVGAYDWKDKHWKGRGLGEYIIYELHVGTFSQSGDFEGAIRHLDHLITLGITAVELMPVSQFPGERNWGYDGVFPFAVQNSYGGPAAMQAFVDACHAKGLAVILDVVYNHMGPEGNYLGAYAPYFTDKYQTPWGQAINVDDAYSYGVREYILENALMWFRDFHVDALRLDAVHAIRDFSSRPILRELRLAVDELCEETKRKHFLIAECDLNDPNYIRSTQQHGLGMHAQWVDEFHHALRIAAGEQPKGYYADFNGLEDLAKAYRDAYVYTGQYSNHRHQYFGAAPQGHAGHQFVVFSQNHDQIGNRMLGERSGSLYGSEMQKLLCGAVLISPYVPFLFMGEEYGETNPFLYFVSHGDQELAKAVREGRRNEFKDFHGDEEAPDPNLEATFEQSRLQWTLLKRKKHNAIFNFYRTFISLRKEIGFLRKMDRDSVKTKVLDDSQVLLVERKSKKKQGLLAILNFGDQEVTVPLKKKKYNWKKVICSSDEEWGGKRNMPETFSDQQLQVPARSISLYQWQ